MATSTARHPQSKPAIASAAADSNNPSPHLGGRGCDSAGAGTTDAATALHRRDEPVPPPGNRLDEPRFVRRVAERLAYLVDCDIQAVGEMPKAPPDQILCCNSSRVTILPGSSRVPGVPAAAALEGWIGTPCLRRIPGA